MTLADFGGFAGFEALLLAFGRDGALVRMAVELAATDPPEYEKLLDVISHPNLAAPQIMAAVKERYAREGFNGRQA